MGLRLNNPKRNCVAVGVSSVEFSRLPNARSEKNMAQSFPVVGVGTCQIAGTDQIPTRHSKFRDVFEKRVRFSPSAGRDNPFPSRWGAGTLLTLTFDYLGLLDKCATPNFVREKSVRPISLAS